MEADKIVEIIKKRRDQFWDSQIVGTGADPLTATGADVARAIADEYDDLLAEIEKSK
jgi:hypothetical protein